MFRALEDEWSSLLRDPDWRGPPQPLASGSRAPLASPAGLRLAVFERWERKWERLLL